MSWCPNTDLSDDLRTSLDVYEDLDNYGLSKWSIRPGKAPLDPAEYGDDDEVHNTPPDAMEEIKFEAYRRKLVSPKKTKQRRWPDDATEDDSVELEICKLIRNTGSDREPRHNPLNSSTTSKTAIALDKYPVAGVNGLYLTSDHFKFNNVYFHSKPEPKKEGEEPVKENGDCIGPTTKTAQSNELKEPKHVVSEDLYVSPAQLYAMKARPHRKC
ncbi:uncharacterized protein LOC119067864 [Bradysia coprophila]|uniref:uncharacterized protein LOC119067864 n=1 Tax=Bradysia coprophila TaxID=38358 RepID=UPI00187DD020|nr:uncharacterized protein LOC119067864 [Bradysia coprophila]XP_037027012.1 uncharacterized protein LOC119067864 [Bradysia coprophila]XP_037027013.1 uncharacterized protein LOC119067864 [Bradysia coprophila]XP_037027014.1 uncharacterized protein LOC119067864 [Bradysia coprophila]